ncbi:Short-chain dehydrogenase/reductase family 16C member [Gryllus bimaculatus]|nr:Short-chain dehydrogenase/reductase family 16C member [Gryllus bimaculatus]
MQAACWFSYEQRQQQRFSFQTLKAFLPHMLQRGRGHVVAMSSMNGLVGSASKTAYCSSKFAVRDKLSKLLVVALVLPVLKPYHSSLGGRWPWLFGAVSAADAARRVVAAVRRNVPELSIPRPLLWAHALHRLFPRRVYELFVDYWEGGASSKKQADGKILALPDIDGNADEIKATVFGVTKSY